jgi:protein-S-isoprenylcysteine O-methyltransferase Ste14
MRIPPPVLFLVAAVAMIVADRFLPGPEIVARPLRPVGIAVIVAGLVLCGVAARHLRRRHTTLRPDREPTRLVTDGPWAFGRNPIYLGLVVMLVGGWIVAGGLTALFAVAAFFVAVERLHVRHEEEVLARRFGADYEAYRTRVRRWL